MQSLADFPVLIVVFGMNGCHACEGYIPTFRKVADRWRGCVPSYVIDANDPRYTAAADHYKIRETPTTIVFRRGVETKRQKGAGSRADVEKLFAFAAQGVECKLP